MTLSIGLKTRSLGFTLVSGLIYTRVPQKICTYTRRTQLNEPHFSCTLVIFVWRPDKCPYCLTSDLRANFPTTEVVTVITAKLKNNKYNHNNVLKFNELLNRIIAQKNQSKGFTNKLTLEVGQYRFCRYRYDIALTISILVTKNIGDMDIFYTVALVDLLTYIIIARKVVNNVNSIA